MKLKDRHTKADVHWRHNSGHACRRFYNDAENAGGYVPGRQLPFHQRHNAVSRSGAERDRDISLEEDRDTG